MEAIFTPTEAAAFAYLPPKRVYKELEYQVIQPISDVPRLSFAALIYLRALKEINFEFSVNFRMNLYQRLVKAIENHASNLEVARFFILQLDGISQELSDLITQFIRIISARKATPKERKKYYEYLRLSSLIIANRRSPL